MTGTANLVAVDHLVRHFDIGGGAKVRAVDDVSFDIRAGETFGLVGESGSGKSTVARLLLRLDRPTAGTVRFDGADVFALGRSRLRSLRREMQIVFQDPYAAVNRRKTVRQIVGLPLSVHRGLRGAALTERVHELLDLVGLRPEFAQRYPHQMSGGQCQRVGIARALALEPRLVVLDEAVSAVDVSVQAQILNLLRDLQRRLGLTYLFVSHDLAIVRYMSETVAVMYHGQIVETARRDALFGNPRHPYTHSLIAAVPDLVPGRRSAATRVVGDAASAVPVHGCRFRDRCPVGRTERRCADVQPPLVETEPGHHVACHFPQTWEGGALRAAGE